MLSSSSTIDLSINRLFAEADAAKHMTDVRGEELARVRSERDAALKDAEKRFNEATAASTKAAEKLMAELGKRGLVPSK